jgi:hypothetical protein
VLVNEQCRTTGETLQLSGTRGGVKRTLPMSLRGMRGMGWGDAIRYRQGTGGGRSTSAGGDARQRAEVAVVVRPQEIAKQSRCGIQNLNPPYRKKLTSDLGWPTSNAIEPKHYVHLFKKVYLFTASRQVRAIWLRWSTSEKSGVFLFVSKIDAPGVIF